MRRHNQKDDKPHGGNVVALVLLFLLGVIVAVLFTPLGPGISQTQFGQLEVDASVNVDHANVDDLLYFSSTPSGGQSSYSFSWNFDDGSFSAVQNPSHWYTSPGTYTAIVTVTDGIGTTADDFVTVLITQPLSASMNCIQLNLDVTCVGSASGGSLPYTFDWSWGDSASIPNTNPASHAFGKVGKYTITLTVTDNVGTAVQVTKEVTMKTACSSFDPSCGIPPSPPSLGISWSDVVSSTVNSIVNNIMVVGTVILGFSVAVLFLLVLMKKDKKKKLLFFGAVTAAVIGSMLLFIFVVPISTLYGQLVPSIVIVTLVLYFMPGIKERPLAKKVRKWALIILIVFSAAYGLIQV